MNVKLITLLGVVTMTSVISCTRCKDCQQTTSTYQAVGNTDSLVTEQSVDLGEVCGDELKDIDGQTTTVDQQVVDPNTGDIIQQTITINYDCN